MVGNEIISLRREVAVLQKRVAELVKQYDWRVRGLIEANNKLLGRAQAEQQRAMQAEQNVNLLLALLGTDPDEPTAPEAMTHDEPTQPAR